ncbi:MAG TPA: phosphatidate cytidylyltransferase [Actinomycetota bacterium]|nr:phosphatidate cytidylyltransferase [Actinomycetota bacterium]
MSPSPRQRGRASSGSPKGQPPAQRSGGRNLKLAILTGVTLAALVVGLLYIGAEAFFGLMIVVVLLAQAEFYRATRNAGHNPATALGLIGGAVVLAGVFLKGPSAAGLALFATLAACFLWFMSFPNRTNLVTNVALTMMGIVYIPLLGSFVGLLSKRPDGRGVTIATIGAAAVYDIFAYAGGSKLGRHRMAPSISPNKSWEGAAVATVATVLVAFFAGPALGPWSGAEAALLGLAVAVVAPLGDLVESMIKRDLGIKDMGTIFPGHGGALDRIDAILFVAPAVWFSLQLFGH